MRRCFPPSGARSSLLARAHHGDPEIELASELLVAQQFADALMRVTRAANVLALPPHPEARPGRQPEFQAGSDGALKGTCEIRGAS